MEKQFYSVKEAAELLGLGISTIFAWSAKGRFPAGRKFGRSRRWALDELRAWAEAQAHQAQGE